MLRELDLFIPAGDHLVVVGPSGIGKSTLAGLIAGVLQPEAGEVRIGGELLHDLHPGSSSASVSSSPRRRTSSPAPCGRTPPTCARAGAIGSSSRLSTPSACDHWPYGSAASTRRSMPCRSAGERQHITLVRAYLSSAPIVVLDEASCHLDPGTEALVESAFSRSGRTLIVIAHRISSALRGRRVLVMDGSDVLVGSHAELQDRSPLYRDLIGRRGADPVVA